MFPTVKSIGNPSSMKIYIKLITVINPIIYNLAAIFDDSLQEYHSGNDIPIVNYLFFSRKSESSTDFEMTLF